MPAQPPLITRRELGRATLARQLLLGRSPLGVTDAIDRLGGLQAQYSPSPYVALWTRLASFERDDLTRALRQRRVVKATLMRGTLHLVTGRDFAAYGAVMAHALASRFATEAQRLGVSAARLRAALDDILAEPRDATEIAARLRHAGVRGHDVADVRWRLLAAHGGAIDEWPSGAWRVFGAARLIAARHALRSWREVEPAAALAHVARRYLAAFGPASRADLAQWSGIAAVRWHDALGALEGSLMRFTSEDGRELLDLRRAPRPHPETTAPVRFLGKWDALLLAHARRDRIVPAQHYRRLVGPNGDVAPTFLVDGEVAGAWAVEERGGEAILSLAPYGRLDAGTRRALAAEAEGLVRHLAPAATRHEVRA